MIQKFKNLRKVVIGKVAQFYADKLIKRLQMLIDIEDDSSFHIVVEQAAKLNAYCIVFHEIYLD